MVGVQNLVGIRLIADFIASLPVRNRKPNLLVVLGKHDSDSWSSPGKLERFFSYKLDLTF